MAHVSHLLLPVEIFSMGRHISGINVHLLGGGVKENKSIVSAKRMMCKSLMLPLIWHV